MEEQGVRELIESIMDGYMTNLNLRIEQIRTQSASAGNAADESLRQVTTVVQQTQQAFEQTKTAVQTVAQGTEQVQSQSRQGIEQMQKLIGENREGTTSTFAEVTRLRTDCESHAKEVREIQERMQQTNVGMMQEAVNRVSSALTMQMLRCKIWGNHFIRRCLLARDSASIHPSIV